MLRTSNPALAVFEQAAQQGMTFGVERRDVMTINGTINASLILLCVLMLSAVGGWALAQSVPQAMMPLWIGSALASLGIFFLLKFKPQAAPYVAVPFAVVEGAFCGGISFMFSKYIAPGIVFQALLLTFGIFFALLLAYRVGMIRLGSTAQRMIVAATGGIFFLYIAVFALSLLGFKDIPFLHDLFALKGGGWLGIGFSLFVVVLASLNLVLDFQQIEDNAKRGDLPKYFNWLGAYGLMVTLVWLYLEILKLLAKLRRE